MMVPMALRANVVLDGVNVRSAPGGKAKDALKRGDRVTLLDLEKRPRHEWARIAYVQQGVAHEGWVIRESLTLVDGDNSAPARPSPRPRPKEVTIFKGVDVFLTALAIALAVFTVMTAVGLIYFGGR
jgi:hypothetical protein